MSFLSFSISETSTRDFVRKYDQFALHGGNQQHTDHTDVFVLQHQFFLGKKICNRKFLVARDWHHIQGAKKEETKVEETNPFQRILIIQCADTAWDSNLMCHMLLPTDQHYTRNQALGKAPQNQQEHNTNTAILTFSHTAWRV